MQSYMIKVDIPIRGVLVVAVLSQIVVHSFHIHSQQTEIFHQVCLMYIVLLSCALGFLWDRTTTARATFVG